MRTQLRNLSRPEMERFVAGVICSLKLQKDERSHDKVIADLVDFLISAHPDMAIALVNAALEHDSKYQKIKDQVTTSFMINTVTNDRLLKRIQTLAGTMGFLAELLDRPRLREHIGELIGIND